MNKYLVLLLLLISCGYHHKDSSKSDSNRFHSKDSLMIPDTIFKVNRKADTTYWIPRDTITRLKNYIRYLVTKDSCCSDNIYINWGNDSVNRIYIVQDAFNLRVYFTPELKHETKDYLILEHGCATDCAAVLFLPLNNYEKVHDILNIVKYNPTNYTVVRSVDNNRENEHEFIEAYNAKTNKIKRIFFKNRGTAANLIFLIDSCKISNDSIYVRAELYDSISDKDMKEEMRLKNDIK